jgi:GNAT superfamily N-acetyltransferase
MVSLFAIAFATYAHAIAFKENDHNYQGFMETSNQSLSILESKESITFNDITALTESVGWGKCFHQTEEKWRYVLAASTYIAYIKEDDKLIAFGRILEDGMMCMFYDICIHPDYQGKGIGTLLMNHLIDKIKDKNYISIGLFTWEGNKTVSEFYGRFGFEKSNAMELKKYMKHVGP